MTEAELRALPVTVDMETAGRAFLMGRTTAYQRARADDFPCEVLPSGRRLIVTKAALLKALGMEHLLQPGETHPGEAQPGEQTAA